MSRLAEAAAEEREREREGRRRERGEEKSERGDASRVHRGIKVDTLGRIKVHERTTKKVPAEKGQEDGTQSRGGREREGMQAD